MKKYSLPLLLALTLLTACDLDKYPDIYPQPQVSISISNNDCQAPCNVSFTSNVVGRVTSYSWNFGDPESGDNNLSDKPNPSHSYQKGMNYDVTLEVNGPGGSHRASTTVQIESLVYDLEIIGGNNQFNAITGEVLEQPFVVQIINTTTGQLATGVPITFEVVQGTAFFQGHDGAQVLSVESNQGKASATLIMGSELLQPTHVVVRLADDVVAVMNPASLTFIAQSDRFEDRRGYYIQIYKVVRLKDGRVWMAENLNYPSENSWCYEENDLNCTQYGRLYTWDAAQGACPYGFELPSDWDWYYMAEEYGGAYTTEAYDALVKGGYSGFEGLFGGYWNDAAQVFGGFGAAASFWSSTPYENSGYYYTLENGYLYRDNRASKQWRYSCRCMLSE